MSPYEKLIVPWLEPPTPCPRNMLGRQNVNATVTPSLHCRSPAPSFRALVTNCPTHVWPMDAIVKAIVDRVEAPKPVGELLGCQLCALADRRQYACAINLYMRDNGQAVLAPYRFFINLKDTEMNWDRIEGNWKQFKGNVKKQWGKLTDDQLDVIAGKRDNLAGKIQETYGISKDEAEKQLTEWQKRMKEINDVK